MAFFLYLEYFHVYFTYLFFLTVFVRIRDIFFILRIFSCLFFNSVC